MTLIDFLEKHWTDIMLILTGIISIASVIVKLTPTKKDDNVLDKILKIVSLHKKQK